MAARIKRGAITNHLKGQNKLHMKPRKLNVRLLRKIQKHILAEPRRFFMGWYVAKGRPGTLFNTDYGHRQQFAACGTAACIAGWACLLSGGKDVCNTCNTEVFDEGAELLNLSTHKAAELFYDTSWPAPFREQYCIAQKPSTRAKIAAARIDHLINTGE